MWGSQKKVPPDASLAHPVSGSFEIDSQKGDRDQDNQLFLSYPLEEGVVGAESEHSVDFVDDGLRIEIRPADLFAFRQWIHRRRHWADCTKQK